jgi:hypothetical protein
MRTINVKLKSKIALSGKLQMEIASSANIAEERLSQLVTGRRNANPEERKAIAEVLGCEEWEIF